MGLGIYKHAQGMKIDLKNAFKCNLWGRVFNLLMMINVFCCIIFNSYNLYKGQYKYIMYHICSFVCIMYMKI